MGARSGAPHVLESRSCGRIHVARTIKVRSRQPSARPTDCVARSKIRKTRRPGRTNWYQFRARSSNGLSIWIKCPRHLRFVFCQPTLWSRFQPARAFLSNTTHEATEGLSQSGCGDDNGWRKPREGGLVNAVSILRRQTNRSAQDRLPRPQFISPPAMCLLRVPLQYPRKTSTLEPRGAQVAWSAPFEKRMEEAPSFCVAWKVRGDILWRGFQTISCSAPRGPHRTGKAHPETKSRQSRPS